MKKIFAKTIAKFLKKLYDIGENIFMVAFGVLPGANRKKNKSWEVHCT